MLVFALVLQGAAALIGALTLIASVPFAGPGGLAILRDCLRTLDPSARGSKLILEYSRNVHRYERMFKRSLNTLFVAHGLPPARHRYGLEPPVDSDFVRLVKSGCGYPGGLCSSVGFDLNPTRTSQLDGFVNPTMALARPPVNFLFSDDSVLPPTYDYVWPTSTAVPVMVPTQVSDSTQPAASAVSLGGLSMVPSPVLSDEVSNTAAHSVDMVDFVPLMAVGLFLLVLAIGPCLVPSRRHSVKYVLNWQLAPRKSSSDDIEFWRKYDDLEAGRVSPGSVAPLGDAPRPFFSSSLTSTSLLAAAPTTVRHIAERPIQAEDLEMNDLSASGRGSVPGEPLGGPPG
ncbi:hypothetical protein EVJ58_g6499 [Rhodofomes roseus]|uniref:Uncharacterized protein n=1 Tax=Rhodofomes roseus TaxID=34475 RepID=A0A4Y9Y9Q9_9APHY|nr:hypothetical protein EVJ58_g6499 [Rhodofomes roseus]